jgi:hypothetical protein
MAGEFRHLRIDSFFRSRDYSYPLPGGGSTDPIDRDKAIHGNKIIRQLNEIRERFDIQKEERLPENIVRDDAVYVEFHSEWGYELKYESLNQEVDRPNYQLLQIKKETKEENGETVTRDKVVVMMRPGGASQFLKKAGEYLVKTTKDREGNNTGLPAHRALFNNIENIQLATLHSFWADEPEIALPDENANIWWEAWFRKTDNDRAKLDQVMNNIRSIGAQVGEQVLEFPEHHVRLIKGTARQLSGSIMLLDNLAELRKPQQLNDFITRRNVDLAEKSEWRDDLSNRANPSFNENHVVVCLLDCGVQNRHPLLEKFLPDDRMFTFKTAWGTDDSWDSGGHGTGMSGLALYGDLTEALSSQENIQIYHGLESFKIAHPADPNDPRLYGAITEYACSVPQVSFPHNPRIFCLSLSDKSQAKRGRPSTWSAAIDKIACGRAMDSRHLFIVSSGNVVYMQAGINATYYSSLNDNESIHDPAQSYNALTVGSYTRMDRIDQTIYQGYRALAPSGGISPSNSTSLMWESHWPIKPDIVMEGGNLAVDGAVIRDDVPTLMPLSLDKEFNTYVFNPFGDTSGAAALAAKLAAELSTAYPKLWPETIKGLIVHSADWTPQMLNGLNFSNATKVQKMNLLRTFGYGVPIVRKAFDSAKNAATLIAENTIQPYKLEGSSDKTNEYHLYNLPWPTDILMDYLGERDVTLKVTLSYFIDPNPGGRSYAYDFSYHSHSLDFKMIRPTETLDEFRRRISATEITEGIAYNGDEEPWALKESVRDRGAIKKDFLVSSGADLSTRNVIAVFPKRGWYRTRKRLGMVITEVRYSLIMSIESEDINTDIYSPIQELIRNVVPIEIVTA